MKHRGPSSSLNPAQEAARVQARSIAVARSTAHTAAATATAAFAAATTMPPSASASALPEGWAFTTDDDGRLVVVHQASGARTVLATPPQEGEQDDE